MAAHRATRLTTPSTAAECSAAVTGHEHPVARTITPSSASIRRHHGAHQEGVPQAGPPAPPRPQPRRSPDAARPVPGHHRGLRHAHRPRPAAATGSTAPPAETGPAGGRTPARTWPRQRPLTPAISGLRQSPGRHLAHIRRRHGELRRSSSSSPPAPTANSTLGPPRPRPLARRSQPRAEIMISGEGLRRTPATSSAPCCTKPPTPWPPPAASRTPAARAATTTCTSPSPADELGLDVTHDPRIGWTVTTVPDHTASAYAAQLEALADAMTLWRTDETTAPTATRRQQQPASPPPAPAAASSAPPPPPSPKPTSPAQACGGSFEPKSLLTLKRQLLAFPALPLALLLPGSAPARCGSFSPEHGTGPVCLPKTPGPGLSTHPAKGRGHHATLPTCSPGDPPRPDAGRRPRRGIFIEFYDPHGTPATACPPTPTTGHPTACYHPPAPRPGLRPGGQDTAAQILWRYKGRRSKRASPTSTAIDLAMPKRHATPAQLTAIAKALRARRTCPTCGTESPTASRAHRANATTARHGGNR